MGKRLELAGKRFGRLVVLKDAGNNIHGASMWKCICDCGHNPVVSAHNLMNGTATSCNSGLQD